MGKKLLLPEKNRKGIDRNRLAVYRRTAGGWYACRGGNADLEISVPFSEIPKKSGQYDRQYPH